MERNEASPTCALLGRLSGAFGLTLSTLLARSETDGRQAMDVWHARPSKARWTDPETGYVRRAISPPGATPELVQVDIPPGARIDYPKSAFTFLRGQCVWVLSGVLQFNEGALAHRLRRGDCLTLGPPEAIAASQIRRRRRCVSIWLR